MPVDVSTLPNDLDELKEQYKSRVEDLENRLELLEEKLKVLTLRFFAPRSEKTPKDQYHLFDELKVEPAAESECRTKEVRSYRRKQAVRKPIPAIFPRKEIVHDVDEEDKVCGCGKQRVEIGQEVTEKLDIKPPEILVERHIRLKYACVDKSCIAREEGEGGAVVTAPAPMQLLPKSMATAGLIAYLVVNKYCDALPLYRQQSIFSRIGVQIPRSTMCGWLMSVYETHLARTEELMLKDIREGPLIGMDETRVQVLKEEGRKNTLLSQMWVAKGSRGERPILLFRYSPSRSGKVALEFLSGYRGCVQTDGYKGYNLVEGNSDIEHFGCWAHARRIFEKAGKAGKNTSSAKQMLKLIGDLYRVEKEAVQKGLDHEGVFELRQEKSRPLLQKIRQWLDKRVKSVPPSLLLGEAINYTLGMWPKLEKYVDYGQVPIDNNEVENAIRPFVIGRNNWKFSGSPRGARAAACFYSLIETAKANGLEPYWYLRYLFQKLPYANTDEELTELLPHRVDKTEIINQPTRA